MNKIKFIKAIGAIIFVFLTALPSYGDGISISINDNKFDFDYGHFNKYVVPGIGSLQILIYDLNNITNFYFIGQVINISDQPVKFNIHTEFTLNPLDKWRGGIVYDPEFWGCIDNDIGMESSFSIRSWSNNLFIRPDEDDGFIIHTSTNTTKQAGFTGIEPGYLRSYDEYIYNDKTHKYILYNMFWGYGETQGSANLYNTKLCEDLSFYLSPRSNFSFYNRCSLGGPQLSLTAPIPSNLFLFLSGILGIIGFKRGSCKIVS